jgi:hypothetical protein
MVTMEEYIGYMIYSGIFILGMFVGLLNDKVQRTKIMRRFTQKNYGLMRITKRGKFIDKVIINMDDDIYKYGKDKAFDPQKGNKHAIYRENEVPIIHYDEVDTKPLILERELSKEAEAYFKAPASMMSSFQAHESAMRREYSNKMLKFANSWSKNVQYYTLGALIAAALAAYFSFQANGKLDELVTFIKTVPATVATIKDSLGLKVI